MATMTYLSRDVVTALLPPWSEQLDLVERTYRDVAAGEVELPPKPGLHPRQDAFLHAMPAWLKHGDAAGLKWVSGYPTNKAKGLAYINGLLILNDADTGVPISVMDCVEITAARTAAATGVCVRSWARRGWSRVAIIGCGEQGNYHARMLLDLNPGAHISGFDVDPDRAAALHGVSEVAGCVKDACLDADIVITTGPFLATPAPAVFLHMLRPDALVLPVDVDSFVHSEVVNASELFLTDYLEQYRYFVSHGTFAGWRDPDAQVGDYSGKRRPDGLMTVCNIGIGALDIAYAAAVYARSAGHGITLPL